MASVVVDKNSALTGRQELSLFSVPPTQVAVTNSFRNIYYPKNGIGAGPITFEIPAGPHFLDVFSITLMVRFKVVRGPTNVPLPPDNKNVMPINYLLNTMWKQIKLLVNSKLMWDSYDTYPFKAYVEAVLGSSTEEKTTILTSAGYLEDDESSFLVVNDDFARGTVAASRAYQIRGGRIVEMWGKLHVDPFCQQRYWPPGVQMQLELFRASDDFCFTYTTGAGPKMVLDNAQLSMRLIEATPSLTLALEKALMRNGGAKYAMRRSTIKQVLIPDGYLDLPSRNISTGLLPRRMVLFMINSEDFEGRSGTSPFKMGSFNLREVQIKAAERMYPPLPMDVNVEGEEFNEAYFALHEVMKRDNGMPCSITPTQFKNGYSFFCFDLSADSSGSQMHFNTLKYGSLDIQMKFRTPLTVAIKALVYLEYDSVLTIDANRNFWLDYTV